jgi:outer membrane protein assembly factor BamB
VLKFKRWLRRLGLAAVVLVLVAACGTPIAGESWAGLSTDGHYIYVAYKEQVFRIDPTAAPDSAGNAHAQWFTQAPNKPHFYAPPAFSDTAIYVGAYDDKFYAFNRTQGGLLNTWNVPTATDKIIGAATVAGNVVYVGIGNQGVRAFDTQTGQLVASYDNTKYGVWSAPLVVGDTVYFASLDHNLYALAAGTLTYKWQIDLGGASAEAPAYVDGVLYVGTFNSEFLAISATNPPQILHRFATGGWVWGSPIVDSGVVYFADLNGTIYALDAKTFAVKWTASDTANAGGIRGKMALVTNAKPTTDASASRLIITGGESKRAYAYNADTGKLVWMSALVMNDKILSDMVVVGSEVVFTTLDENQLVVALNVNTGQTDWQLSLSKETARFQPTAVPSS